MKSLFDNLQDMANEILEMLENLLLNHSALYPRNDKTGHVVLITPYPYAYRELSETGRQIQWKLLDKYRRFILLLQVLLQEAPKDIWDQLTNADSTILGTIEQKPTGCQTTQEAFIKAREALCNLLALVKTLYAPSPDDNVLLVPDTNALLYNHELDKWEFGGIPRFTLILTPTVLSELDALKINHRNEQVRDKANSLIRQIQEFRRRGRLVEGVTIVEGRSTLLAVATEPRIEQSLPWLDPQNNDDRILATAIEIMRRYPQSIVAVVSRDINLQNKAEFACIPVIKPPNPPASQYS